MSCEVDMLVRGVIFDIDGVLEYQGNVYPGAIETIQTLRERDIQLRFLTNSTLKSHRSAAEKLHSKGFRIYAEEVITASYATALYLRKLDPHSIWLMLEREGREEFTDFTLDSNNPEYIVIGDYRDNFNFSNLNKALRLLLSGARLIGMSSEEIDASLGEPELNVGAWVKMLEQASGVPAVYIGKPSRFVFEITLASLGLRKEAVIMVGDRVASDVVGAREAGVRSILIRSGEFQPHHLDGSIQPDYIVDSIQDIMPIILPLE